MVRLVVALAAIIILALSAGLTRGQPHAATLIASARGPAAMYENADTFRAELLLMKRAAPARSAPISASQAESPAPALLVYLGLVLVGSAGSVALARRRLGGEG